MLVVNGSVQKNVRVRYTLNVMLDETEKKERNNGYVIVKNKKSKHACVWRNVRVTSQKDNART